MDTSDAQTRSAPQQSRDYKYLILYLTPNNIIEKDETLKIQWNAIRTIIPCLIKVLKDGELEVRMDDFEMAISGLRNIKSTNIKNVHEHNILGRTADLWYFLTKRFHQSIGPRKGNFMEELIISWMIKKYGNNVKRNIQLKKLLKNYYGITGIESRSMIDFAIIDKRKRSLHLVELRANEETGGRTAQQSLLDKFDLILKYLEDGKIKLREQFTNKGTWNIYMDIAILFSQNTFELLNKENYNKGRLTSLIEYMMEEKHIWGHLIRLKDYYISCNDKEITKEQVRRNLEDNRSICIKRKIDNNEFKVYIRILFGNEFFEEYIGKSLSDLLRESHVADDIWLFYTLILNELKIAQEFGKTHVKNIYDLLTNTNIFKEFEELYYKNKYNGIETFLNKFNDLINKCLSIVISKPAELGELRLLETNDVAKIIEYLKQVCIGSLALYMYERDGNKRQCNWEETTTMQ